jgi:hypothetical protein
MLEYCAGYHDASACVFNKIVGGAEAMFEPLSDNYEDYEWGLSQYFGYGVQACYRGFR